MAYDIYTISSYAPRQCGIATFNRNLIGALKHGFTGEVGSIEVFAIDDSRGRLEYDPLVELRIDQFDSKSWTRAAAYIITRSTERQNKPIVIMQHEFGLDGEKAHGSNYPSLAKILKSAEIPIFSYLHTVQTNPNEHQKDITNELSKYSKSLIVTAQSAIKILEKYYNINPQKVKHIDHGIRMHDRSKYDRDEIKKRYGLEEMLIISTPGLKSPNKGLEYGIEAYSAFLKGIPPKKRENIVYLFGGAYHPTFIKQEPELHKKHLELIEQKIKEGRLQHTYIKHLENLRKYAKKKNLVFLEQFLEEEVLLDLYGISDIIMIPYRNPEQISSGILADAVGSGTVVISTNFLYSEELLNGTVQEKGEDLTIGERGILVKLGEPVSENGLYTPSIKGLTQGIKYLASNPEKIMQMSEKAYERGHRMNWQNVARDLIQLIKFHEGLKQN